jgi:hypothetical protein
MGTDVNPSACTSKSPSANENSSSEEEKKEAYARRLTQIENNETEFDSYEQYEYKANSKSGDVSNKRSLDDKNVEGICFASLAKRFKSFEVCDGEKDAVLASNIK